MLNLINSAHAVVDLSLPVLNDTSDLGTFVSSLYTYAIAIVGVCVFIQFIRGGVTYLLAAGNSGKTTKAIDMMRNAVIGAVLLFSSYFILNVINPDLVSNTFNFNIIQNNSGQTPQVKTPAGGGLSDIGGNCQDDKECKAGLFCSPISFSCYKPSDVGQNCEQDSDCKPGLFCSPDTFSCYKK